MKDVDIFEAKTHLSSLIEAVERGESFTITKRNQPIALLIPLDQDRRSQGLAAAEEVRKLRTEINARMTLDEILQCRDEGRK